MEISTVQNLTSTFFTEHSIGYFVNEIYVFKSEDENTIVACKIDTKKPHSIYQHSKWLQGVQDKVAACKFPKNDLDIKKNTTSYRGLS